MFRDGPVRVLPLNGGCVGGREPVGGVKKSDACLILEHGTPTLKGIRRRGQKRKYGVTAVVEMRYGSCGPHWPLSWALLASALL